MGHLFSRSKKSSVTEQDKAVLKLKSTRDKLHQYQKRADITLIKDREVAKKLLKENKKERAKLLLKKKRYIEGKLDETDKQLNMLEKLIQDLEFTQIEMKVVDSLKVGNEVLKDLNALLNVEDIEKIMDETQEAVEKQREIDALISGASLSDEDIDAIEEELEELIEKEIEKQMPDVPAAKEDIILPGVPAAKEEDIILPEVPSELPGKEKPVKTKERVAVLAE